MRKSHTLIYAILYVFTFLSINNVQAQEQPNGFIKTFTDQCDTYLKPFTAKTSEIKQVPQTEALYKWENDDWVIQKMYNTEYNDLYQMIHYYIHNYYEGDLLETYHYEYEYGNDGNIKTYIEQYKPSYEFDYVNMFRYELKYDDVCKDYLISQNEYEWEPNSEEWCPNTTGYTYYIEIKRDAANRVTSRTYWDSEDKNYALNAIYYEYDSTDGPASSIIIKQMDEDSHELIPIYLYDEIKWKKSNCQYLYEKSNIYNLFDDDSNNIVKSFVLYDITENGDKFKSFVSNKYENGGKERKQKTSILSADGVNILNTYEYDFDENGSYNYYYDNWKDLNNNGVYDDGEIAKDRRSFVIMYRFDKYGNEINRSYKKFNTETKKYDIDVYTYVNKYQYFEDGTIIEYEHSYYSKGKLKTKEKTVYSNFIDYIPTSIKDTQNNIEIAVHDGYVTATDGARYQIFDIQGRLCKSGIVTSSTISLEDLSEGIYIVRVNNKNIKVIKR